MADGGRELHVNAPRFAAWGQAYAVREALARGLVASAEFDVETFQWTVGAFEPRTLELFSKGRRAVRDEAAQSADGSALSVRTRSGRDRAAKRRVTGAKSGDQPTWTQLRERCRAEAAAERISLDFERDRYLTPRSPQPADWSDAQWAWAVEGAVCANSATTSRAKVLAHVDLATALMPDDQRERIAAAVLDGAFARSHPSHDRGMKDGGHQFASRPVLQMENELTAMFVDGRGVIDRVPARRGHRFRRRPVRSPVRLSAQRRADPRGVRDGPVTQRHHPGVGSGRLRQDIGAVRSQ